MGNGCGVRREDGVCLYVYSGEREREREEGLHGVRVSGPLLIWEKQMQDGR